MARQWGEREYISSPLFLYKNAKLPKDFMLRVLLLAECIKRFRPGKKLYHLLLLTFFI
jgi:hypothetical protein